MSGKTLTPSLSARRYFEQSRDSTNSLILVAPLFVVYQVGILATDGWRNGADLVTGWLFALTGGSVVLYTGLNVAVLAACLALYLRRRSIGALHPRTALLVPVESTVYAMVAGFLVSELLLRIGLRPAFMGAAADTPSMGPLDTVVLSIGAGTYEELVFRGLLMSGLAALFLRRTRSRILALAGAVFLSSAVFSAFHYWPLGMDPWELWSFAFRFMLGVAFALLYLWRGFAVAVYTHAIYDIFVLLPGSLLN